MMVMMMVWWVWPSEHLTHIWNYDDDDGDEDGDCDGDGDGDGDVDGG